MTPNDIITILGLEVGELSLVNGQPVLLGGVTLNDSQQLVFNALSGIDVEAQYASPIDLLSALQSALLSESVTGWLLQRAVEQESLGLTPTQSSADVRAYRQAVRALNDGIDSETWTWADFTPPVPAFTL